MQENEFLEEYKSLIKNLFDILEVKLNELTEQEKELIIAYSFGIISEVEQEVKISKELKYSAVKKTIIEVLEYNEKETNDILKKLIKDIHEKTNKVYNIMIHQGKFIYSKYKEKSYNEVYDNLTNMIDVIVSEEYKTY